MSNNTSATAAVPMPAAMAGLTGDFTSVRGVLSELGRDMAAGGAFFDTVMGFNHPSMMDDRHDRVTSDVCGSAVLQAAVAALTADGGPCGPPPMGHANYVFEMRV